MYKGDMMKKVICLFFMIMLPFFSSIAMGDEGWQQVTDKEGIKVYTRFAPGYTVKEFLAVAIVDATPIVVNRVVDDAANFRDWMFECPDSALLEQKGTNSVMWVVTSAPFPVSKRDMVMETIVTIGKDKIVRKFYPVTHPAKPVTKKYIRMPKFEGIWTFTAVSGGTEVRYQLKTDRSEFNKFTNTRSEN